VSVFRCQPLFDRGTGPALRRDCGHPPVPV